MDTTFAKNQFSGMSVEERFWEKVKVLSDNECWEWQGGRDKKGREGYGTFKVNKNRRTKAHIFSYEINNGKISDGLSVLHKCDNPSCVNPKHLFLGTYLENSQDKFRKGRQRFVKGIEHPMVKLSEDDVRSIQKRYKKGNGKELAQEFGISLGHVCKVAKGNVVWKFIK